VVHSGDTIVRKRVEHGTVWITVRVSRHLYDIVATSPGEWGSPLWGGIQHGSGVRIDGAERDRAVTFVRRWVDSNAAELEPLFRQAERQRRPRTPFPHPPEALEVS
jgi:hypothetical protein